jgi:hypothetical protein
MNFRRVTQAARPNWRFVFIPTGLESAFVYDRSRLATRKLPMKKLLSSFAAVALGATSFTVAADTGQFFLDGGIGRSSYDAPSGQSYNDKTDWATSIRGGYMWHHVVDYGVEFGYADLGQEANRYVYRHNVGSDYVRDSTAAHGWLLGGRLEYVMGQSWYLMARGGWFRPRITQESADWILTRGGPLESFPASGYSHDQNSFNTGTHAYYGLGVGYCISTHWRVGLNYDDYGLGALLSGYHQGSTRVNTFSATVQFRF